MLIYFVVCDVMLEKSEQFLVEKNMFKHLKILNIEASNLVINKPMTWGEVYSAYKKRSVVVHPDKCNGSNEAFLKLTAALNALEHSIVYQKDQIKWLAKPKTCRFFILADNKVKRMRQRKEQHERLYPAEGSKKINLIVGFLLASLSFSTKTGIILTANNSKDRLRALELNMLMLSELVMITLSAFFHLFDMGKKRMLGSFFNIDNQDVEKSEKNQLDLHH